MTTLAEYDTKNEFDLSDQDLKITDFENILGVYKDDDNNIIYNLNSTLKINVDKNTLQTFVCNADMHWPIISYKIYSTTRLAWLLMQLNNVSIENVFLCIESGNEVKYLPKEQLKSLLSYMQQFSN